MSEFRIRGIVGTQPQIRSGPHGQFVTFNVADNQSRRTEDGSWEQVATTWYSVLVNSDRLMNLVLSNVEKGQLVEIEANFVRASVYTANDGSVRPSLRITARSVSLPLSRQMGHKQQEEVVTTVQDFDGNKASQIATDEVPFN